MVLQNIDPDFIINMWMGNHDLPHPILMYPTCLELLNLNKYIVEVVMVGKYHNSSSIAYLNMLLFVFPTNTTLYLFSHEKLCWFS